VGKFISLDENFSLSFPSLDGRGLRGISAQLFCKHSQVTFMPYGVVLKDERSTLNPATSGKRPTSNKKTEPYPGFTYALQRSFF